MGKRLGALRGRDFMRVRMAPPRVQCTLILPDLVGHQQVLPRQTFEAIDEEAPAHGLKLGLQRSCKVEVLVHPSWPGPDLKEQANHRNSQRLHCSATGDLLQPARSNINRIRSKAGTTPAGRLCRSTSWSRSWWMVVMTARFGLKRSI